MKKFWTEDQGLIGTPEYVNGTLFMDIVDFKDYVVAGDFKNTTGTAYAATKNHVHNKKVNHLIPDADLLHHGWSHVVWFKR